MTAAPRPARPAALPMELSRTGVPHLPRHGIGLPGRRRPSPVRKAEPGSLPVRARPAHDPGQAGELRAAFSGFDIPEVARFGERDVERLLQDAGIVRHRGRAEAVTDNARCAQVMHDRDGSLAAFVWHYEPAPAELPEPQTASTSPTSTALSKDLRKLGRKFVGPTTVFAFIQAMGLINDHAVDCAIRPVAERERRAFAGPGH